MKSYAIYDGDLNRKSEIGYLFYFEKAEEFVIELCEDLDEWEAPLLFQGYVKKKVYTIPKDISLLWVKERIIPSTRQNIGMILKNHKLPEYSEMAFLKLAKGKCSQDNCYIKEIAKEEIPQAIKDRQMKNIMECFVSEDRQLICLFQDNTVRKTDLKKLLDKYKEITYILKNEPLLNSVKVGVGGYSISFNETIEIQAEDLRRAGVLLPITAGEFYGFVKKNIVDTGKACELLGCSRQNISYLVKENKMTPVLQGTKENFFTKGEIIRYLND